jgi:hypothetical protein
MKSVLSTPFFFFVVILDAQLVHGHRYAEIGIWSHHHFTHPVMSQAQFDSMCATVGHNGIRRTSELG